MVKLRHLYSLDNKLLSRVFSIMKKTIYNIMNSTSSMELLNKKLKTSLLKVKVKVKMNGTT